jgi:hypothetical protein
MTTDYGHLGNGTNYGSLFGPVPALYGGAGSLPGGGGTTGTGQGRQGDRGDRRRHREKVWLAGTRPGRITVRSVAFHHVIVPMYSHREQLPIATPLPASYRHWNDAQDLADILRLIGMT